jgi:hypothetical protein
VRLRDTVGTDVERFVALASSDDPARWVRALGLVRGPLFAGLGNSDWAVFDGTQPWVESQVVLTALRVADLGLRGRSGCDPEWALRRALLVSPYDERLYRALLRATAAQGNRVGLRSTMAQLLTLAGEAENDERRPPAVRHEDVEQCLHPDTATLYRDLVQGSPATGGHSSRL